LLSYDKSECILKVFEMNSQSDDGGPTGATGPSVGLLGGGFVRLGLLVGVFTGIFAGVDGFSTTTS
jgi:hypothetical protein